MSRDPRVDAFIEPLPDWQQAVFRELREIIHEAEPEIEETIKRTTQPYFVLKGNVCAFLAAKDHVNLFLYDPIAPDTDGIITAGHDNKTGRQIAFHRGDPIPRRPIVALLRAIVANNRAGGWRQLKRA
ncbi:MAG TPA: DUF1801 domain-containing protein [Candidatus Polarisedimenticolia bacterium]|nr:DUF1801 domain-containing protein [Candidatus Polarisedimenticolia bacterium]